MGYPVQLARFPGLAATRASPETTGRLPVPIGACALSSSRPGPSIQSRRGPRSLPPVVAIEFGIPGVNRRNGSCRQPSLGRTSGPVRRKQECPRLSASGANYPRGWFHHASPPKGKSGWPLPVCRPRHWPTPRRAKNRGRQRVGSQVPGPVVRPGAAPIPGSRDATGRPRHATAAVPRVEPWIIPGFDAPPRVASKDLRSRHEERRLVALAAGALDSLRARARGGDVAS